MKGILQGLGSVHEKDYVHRDIKPDNIMLTKSDHIESNSIKLVDFGLSAAYKISFTNHLEEKIGTILFMAPE